jgi:hypothetical protein
LEQSAARRLSLQGDFREAVQARGSYHREDEEKTAEKTQGGDGVENVAYTFYM